MTTGKALLLWLWHYVGATALALWLAHTVSHRPLAAIAAKGQASKLHRISRKSCRWLRKKI